MGREQVMTMPNVVCFCGRYFRFDGDIGACPQCGEYATLRTVSSEEQHQMRDELDFVLAAHEPRVSLERSAEHRADLGR